jgi:hypothetical protein
MATQSKDPQDDLDQESERIPVTPARDREHESYREWKTRELKERYSND